MNFTPTEVGAIFILFLGAFLQAVFGFGSAIIAMPLLVITLGISFASPLVALMGVVMNSLIVISTWRQIDWRSAWKILLSSTLAMPIGLLVILYAPENWIKGFLGVFLIAYGIYSLLPLPPVTIKNERWVYFFGAIAGILGSAYNINGPPVILYGNLRRWDPDRFRATLNGYFLPSGLFVTIGHGIAGLWTNQVWLIFAVSIPFLFLAAWLGRQINRRIKPEKFNKLLYVVLIGMGILLLVSIIT